MPYKLICPTCGARNSLIQTTVITRTMSIDPRIGTVFYAPNIDETLNDLRTYTCSLCKCQAELKLFIVD